MAEPFRFDLEETFPQLAKPPIVEAVLHFKVVVTKAPDPVVLKAKLAAQLAEQYPEIQENRRFVVEAFFKGHETLQAPASIDFQGVRLIDQKKVKIAQFNMSEFIFSWRHPYENWNAFIAEAKRLWKIYRLSFECTDIERIGLRFINRLEIPVTTSLSSILPKTPEPLKPIGLSSDTFQSRTAHSIPGWPFAINVFQGTEDFAEALVRNLIVDVDVYTTETVACDDGVTLEDYLHRMRWLKNKVFFGLISKRMAKTLT